MEGCWIHALGTTLTRRARLRPPLEQPPESRAEPLRPFLHPFGHLRAFMFRLSGLTCDFSYLFDRSVHARARARVCRGPRLSRWEWTASLCAAPPPRWRIRKISYRCLYRVDIRDECNCRGRDRASLSCGLSIRVVDGFIFGRE